MTQVDLNVHKDVQDLNAIGNVDRDLNDRINCQARLNKYIRN